jgi:hypothetical protein
MAPTSQLPSQALLLLPAERTLGGWYADPDLTCSLRSALTMKVLPAPNQR